MRESTLDGYHLDEYRHMFGLVDADFDGRILEYNSGVNAVNAQLHARHLAITSCDPWFQLDKPALAQLVESHAEQAIDEMKKTLSRYDFSEYGSVDALIEKRRQGIAMCLADYEKGRAEKRYVSIEHDILPFADDSFDLALSSHCFFTGALDQDVDTHLQRIRALAHVAKEVRIYPLVDSDGQPSHLLGPVLLGLQQGNFAVEIREVDYHLQRGSYAMLRIWARECQV